MKGWKAATENERDWDQVEIQLKVELSGNKRWLNRVSREAATLGSLTIATTRSSAAKGAGCDEIAALDQDDARRRRKCWKSRLR